MYACACGWPELAPTAHLLSPTVAAAEVSALFDAVVRTRLAQQPPHQESDADAQHMVVARAHADVIRPLLKDMALILCESPPYHKLKPAVDRLTPLLLSHNMNNCMAVVRGWLALLEEPVDPAKQHGRALPDFWQARMEGTGLTLGQTIDAGVCVLHACLEGAGTVY